MDTDKLAQDKPVKTCLGVIFFINFYLTVCSLKYIFMHVAYVFLLLKCAIEILEWKIIRVSAEGKSFLLLITKCS